jgi:hypothetical protein
MKGDSGFPVLNKDHGSYGAPISGCPEFVPWELINPHERQAQSNHDQTLRRLAERGGLCPEELYYVLRDEPYNYRKTVLRDLAVRYINARVAALVSATLPRKHQPFEYDPQDGAE